MNQSDWSPITTDGSVSSLILFDSPLTTETKAVLLLKESKRWSKGGNSYKRVTNLARVCLSMGLALQTALDSTSASIELLEQQPTESWTMAECILSRSWRDTVFAPLLIAMEEKLGSRQQWQQSRSLFRISQASGGDCGFGAGQFWRSC